VSFFALDANPHPTSETRRVFAIVNNSVLQL
jgi:hypothetical protein